MVECQGVAIQIYLTCRTIQPASLLREKKRQFIAD